MCASVSVTACVLPRPLRGTGPRSVWGFDSRPPLGSLKPPAFWPGSGRSRPCPRYRSPGSQVRTRRPQDGWSLPLLHLWFGSKASTSHQACCTDKATERRQVPRFCIGLFTSILLLLVLEK